jgi:uncharacterized protein (DUF362 family)
VPSHRTSRREFVCGLAAAGGAGLLLGCHQRGASAQPARSRVVMVSCPALARPGASLDRGVLRRMLEQGLRQLAGTADARAALGRWVRPGDTVGLKVNCLAGRHMSTRVELVEELVGLLAATGLPRQSALVFDRSDLDLRHGGFQPRSGGRDYQVLGNDRAGYDEEPTLMPSGASRLSRVLTHRASVLINLPVLKDHGIAGVSGSLKNNFGLIHNPNKYHLNGCHPHVAEVNSVPVVRRKQRLIICDALHVQVDGGPGYFPAAAVPASVVLLATDPVALDVIAWELLEQLRAKRKLKSLTADKRRPVHIAGAAQAGLGVGDRHKIDVVRLTVS